MRHRLAAEPELAGVFGQVENFLCPSVPPEQAGRYRIVTEPQPGWLLGALLIRRARFEAVGGFTPANDRRRLHRLGRPGATGRACASP